MEFTAKIVSTRLEIIRKYRGSTHYPDLGHEKDHVTQNSRKWDGSKDSIKSYKYQITSMVASVWEITACVNKTKFK